MDASRALLIDLVNFLDTVEARIMNKTVDLSDPLQITNMRHCFNTMDSMLKQCETSISTHELSEIRDRIKVARETVEMVGDSGNLKKTDQIYGDLYLIQENHTKEEEYKNYGRHLGMSNEQFDKLVDEWAEDRDTSQKAPRKRKANKIENFQDQIKGELAQLADTMKSKAMRYRDILVKDNKALLKFTGEQEKQLDTVTHVAKQSAKLVKTKSISLWNYGCMIASIVALPWLIVALFMFT